MPCIFMQGPLKQPVLALQTCCFYLSGSWMAALPLQKTDPPCLLFELGRMPMQSANQQPVPLVPTPLLFSSLSLCKSFQVMGDMVLQHLSRHIFSILQMNSYCFLPPICASKVKMAHKKDGAYSKVNCSNLLFPCDPHLFHLKDWVVFHCSLHVIKSSNK